MAKLVFHLLCMSTFSGAENVVCQIMNMFSDDEDIEMVYCSPDGPIREILRNKNIRFVPLKKFSLPEIRKTIREIKPDIIHAHDMRASLAAALTCGKTPLVSHIHNNQTDARRVSIKSVLYLYAGIKAKSILWVSQSAYEEYAFKKAVDNKSSVLKNIIDVEQTRFLAETAITEKKYEVVFVGRLTYPKNPERLMKVLNKVLNKKRGVKVAIIGDGELRDVTKQLCDRYELNRNIDFLGFIENPLAYMKQAKVLVMVSRWEGTPMCVLEALSLGTPVVSTPTDGIKQVITDGENGYLSDDDDVLADKIISIVSEESLFLKLSEKAKKMSEQYNSIEKYKKEILKCYYEAVNS